MLNFIGSGRVDELKLYQEMRQAYGKDKADNVVVVAPKQKKTQLVFGRDHVMA